MEAWELGRAKDRDVDFFIQEDFRLDERIVFKIVYRYFIYYRYKCNSIIGFICCY